MLVKLGNSWFEPEGIAAIIQPSSELEEVRIDVKTSGTGIYIPGNADAFAGVVNSALQTQSYGGVELPYDPAKEV